MFSILLAFLGGLGIFLYGTHVLGNALQQLAATRMRTLLSTVTNTRWKGVLSGIVVTFFLQSSTVTSILVVGLVGGSVITLSQAFGVILGSAIGTTFTVQVLTFDIAKYSASFIFIGTIFIMFLKKRLYQNTGSIFLSIGFIFFGIGAITSSLEPLSKNQEVLSYLTSISANPVLFALLAMVLTALMHSSAAMIIIGIAFVQSDVLTLQAVIPLVLGANIGSTFPAVISSFASTGEGRKLALFNVLFKGTGVILALISLTWVIDIVPFLSNFPSRQIANFHTLFNVTIATLFFPIVPLVDRLFSIIFPLKESTVAYNTKLNNNLLEIPTEALNSSHKEIVRLSEHVQDQMIMKLREYIEKKVSKKPFFEVENTIDTSYILIQQYLLKIGQKNLSEAQSKLEVKLLNILNDIENIGDTTVQFIQKAQKIEKNNIELTEKDLNQIINLLGYIETTFQNSVEAFQKQNHILARQTIQSQASVEALKKDIKFEHFNSLIHKQEHNPNISAIYLDVINELTQLHHFTVNVSRTVLGLV